MTCSNLICSRRYRKIVLNKNYIDCQRVGGKSVTDKITRWYREHGQNRCQWFHFFMLCVGNLLKSYWVSHIQGIYRLKSHPKTCLNLQQFIRFSGRHSLAADPCAGNGWSLKPSPVTKWRGKVWVIRLHHVYGRHANRHRRPDRNV